MKQLDDFAMSDYTSRSDVIRQALLDYLRQAERPPRWFNKDPETTLYNLNNRRLTKYLEEIVDDIHPPFDD